MNDIVEKWKQFRDIPSNNNIEDRIDELANRMMDTNSGHSNNIGCIDEKNLILIDYVIEFYKFIEKEISKDEINWIVSLVSEIDFIFYKDFFNVRQLETEKGINDFKKKNNIR